MSAAIAFLSLVSVVIDIPQGEKLPLILFLFLVADMTRAKKKKKMPLVAISDERNIEYEKNNVEEINVSSWSV